VIRFLRRLLGLGEGQPEQPDASKARALTMHLMGAVGRSRCGAPWTPADPLTIELKVVTCKRCWAIGQREQIARIAKRR